MKNFGDKRHRLGGLLVPSCSLVESKGHHGGGEGDAATFLKAGGTTITWCKNLLGKRWSWVPSRSLTANFLWKVTGTQSIGKDGLPTIIFQGRTVKLRGGHANWTVGIFDFGHVVFKRLFWEGRIPKETCGKAGDVFFLVDVGIAVFRDWTWKTTTSSWQCHDLYPLPLLISKTSEVV